MKTINNALPAPPDVVELDDETLKEIYQDYEADYWIEQNKAGLLDVVEL